MATSITGCCISISALLVLTVFPPPVYAATSDQGTPPLTDEQKMEKVREYFETPYQEEDYFRTNRLLLTATKHLEPAARAPAIASVITAEEIRNMGARNLLDILEKVPGLGTGISTIPVFHGIETRGIKTLNGEKVLLMINGHNINESMHSSSVFFFQYMSVERIKQLEIIRGPGSALYGANAFLGIINIITKDAEDVDGLQVTVGGGSFDTRHYNLLYGYEGEKIQLTASVDYLDTDGESLFVERDAIGNSGHTLLWQNRPDLAFKLTCGNFMLSGGYLRNEMGPYIGAGFALNDETSQEWGQYYADLVFREDVTETVEITARLYGDLVVLDPFWELYPEGTTLGPFTYPDGMIGNPASKHRKVGAEIDTVFSFSGHLITVGVMGENIDQYEIVTKGNFDSNTYAPTPSFQNKAPFNQEVTRDIWAVYLQDVWRLTDDVTLTAGLRHDHYSDFGGTTNPRAGLVWGITANTSLKLLYGSAFRAPSFSELYHANNPSLLGNVDLDPEEIRAYEIGLERRFIIDYSFWTFKMNYFSNSIDKLIVQGTSLVPPKYINRGSAEVDGVETELHFDFGNDFYGYLNYSYQNPRDGDTDARLQDVPTHRAKAGINFAPWKHLNANISVSMVGERPRGAGDPRPDLSAQKKVDLTLIARNFSNSLEIRGSAYNLLAEDYRDPSPDLKVPADFPTNERSFLLEIRYTF